MKVLIRKIKLQTCWILLESFGYNESLRIREEFLVPKDIFETQYQHCENIELSAKGREFLSQLFNQFRNVSDCLSEEEIATVFQTCPFPQPFDIKADCQCTEDGINFANWIGLWQKLFSESYEKGFEYLSYLGFTDTFEDAIIV